MKPTTEEIITIFRDIKEVRDDLDLHSYLRGVAYAYYSVYVHEGKEDYLKKAGEIWEDLETMNQTVNNLSK